ncbi:glutamine synthetase family protein [Methanobacterium petrolearium]|uniref:glutamine synthetase family protein n=1 Tax=Methanobacterium petrolearium TaxID=710190 RepID=UPI001AE8F1A6|nr:glutamine synthetase family protein [Methanobacterium petrolearium]MBP1945217.1 glutamine synthetase [Methanobacterium petrolearium]BDZ71150.1 glutamine synthetase [Methanobacterium petrolearium]
MNEIKNMDNSKTQFIRVLWCDNANIIRAKAVHVDAIKDNNVSVGISRGQQGVPGVYDGVVAGSGLDPVGEITLKGDMSTLTIIPYAPGHARVMGDMTKNGKVWENCPRGFLKKMISDTLEEGLEVKAAFENEFYLLKKDGEFNPYISSDSTPFASTYSMDINYEVIGDMVKSLISQDVGVEQYYPESGPGQHEITVNYADALKAADNQIIFRETVRAVAHKHELQASFLPKIFPDTAGSGCHIHLSLWKNGKNVLQDSENDYSLSGTAQQFIAGILNHLPSLMAITTPIPRSYRRIQPQKWVGAFNSWGLNNREAAIRVIREEDSAIKHFEFKTVDASSNPYLALGAVIAAGLDGIKKMMELPEPVMNDPATLTPAERDKIAIKPLPTTLEEALNNLKEDEVLMDALGIELSQAYIAVKEEELSLIEKLDPKKEIELLADKY